MNTTPALSEVARVEELLARLDPDPGRECRVPGCLHLHLTPDRRDEVAALAA